MDLAAVAAFRIAPDLQGLCKKASGIEGDDIDVETLSENRVGNRLIFYAKTGRKYDAALIAPRTLISRSGKSSRPDPSVNGASSAVEFRL